MLVGEKNGGYDVNGNWLGGQNLFIMLLCVYIENFQLVSICMADQSQTSASALQSFNHKPKTEYEAIIPKFLLNFSFQ